MLFYSAQFTDYHYRDTHELSDGMLRSLTHTFFHKHNKKVYVGIEEICSDLISLFVAIDSKIIKESTEDLMLDILSDFFSSMNIFACTIDFEEITYSAFSDLSHSSWFKDIMLNHGAIMKMLGLDDIDYCNFNEGIIVEKNDSEILSEANTIMFSDSLITEIKRIQQGSKKSDSYGHPVHYIIQAEDKEQQSNIAELLLSALYANKRIKSTRYSTLLCVSGYSGRNNFDTIYKLNKGGAVVVNYEPNIESSANHAYPDIELISSISASVNKYKNDVLTILILPLLSDNAKDSFLARLGTMIFVQLKEEIIYGNKAKKFLKAMALNVGIKPDSKLLNSSYNAERAYSASELKKLFDRWYSVKLRNNIYPQYARLDSCESITKKKRHRGDAYAKLHSLIGLTEAKKVMDTALDFYKAQLLFKDKGIDTNKTAIHMVFTGNPGTAKTTVARLFAQILKDNGYLSIGDLIEVGRADLVGKYVGWTAPIVKAKFQAAKGSVLFIDEAYSLVDGNPGLYGDEAINTIVQEMENNREDTVVIFAGYPDKMAAFLDRNPGLKSRIAFHIPFNDYSPKELYEILELMANDSKMILSDGIKDKVLNIFEKVYKQENFGNGRYVRNMFEKAKQRQGSRLIRMDAESVTKDDVQTLLPEDFEEEQNTSPQSSTIGF
ncbi:MAG: Stage V sporulation protein K [Firmicutes bacterium ADurb.Bin099]|nr:MAG: Stage V sporulation protein K [Firmicutes bacterium ADurb.Bin099]